MPNLDLVHARLATGRDLPARRVDAEVAIHEWRSMGITHIVDNRAEYSDQKVVAELAPEISYLHVGVHDAGGRQPDEWFDTGVAWVHEALASPTARVLSHCHMGINRGPSMAYAVLIDCGWDPVAAIDAIRAARPIAAVGYAEDALDWHHRRNGVAPAKRHDDVVRLRRWRDEHPLDVIRIIRDIRRAEQHHVA